MLWLVAWVAWGCTATGAGAAEPEPFDLQGSWYVLVHYRDSVEASGRDSAAALRKNRNWEDKVWTFEPRGSRLLWTEYPLLVFDDEAGRFEKLASGRLIKSPGPWEPNARQLAQIAAGLSVNPQWARGKSLKGDPKRGYRSVGAAHRESASVIGYSEAWEIRDLDQLPVFQRSDEMSSVRSASLVGRTRYQSDAVTRNPDRLTGSFLRDPAQRGSFLMIRSGRVELARPKDGKDRSDGKDERDVDDSRMDEQ